MAFWTSAKVRAAMRSLRDHAQGQSKGSNPRPSVTDGFCHGLLPLASATGFCHWLLTAPPSSMASATGFCHGLLTADPSSMASATGFCHWLLTADPSSAGACRPVARDAPSARVALAPRLGPLASRRQGMVRCAMPEPSHVRGHRNASTITLARTSQCQPHRTCEDIAMPAPSHLRGHRNASTIALCDGIAPSPTAARARPQLRWGTSSRTDRAVTSRRRPSVRPQVHCRAPRGDRTQLV